MLPIMQSDSQEMTMMQTRWATEINPILKNPALKSIILQDVPLVIGSNTINHKLGRKLQGWKIVRLRAAASVYDNQDSNQTQSLTLVLVSNAAVVVDLEVF